MSKAPKHDVVAVVVTYNRAELLAKCLKALETQDCDVLIIDNASTDGTKEKITNFVKKPNFLYENTGKNIGGAGGFNLGMRRAAELGYKYIWVMDDDCIVQKDSLSELLKTDKKLNGNYGWLSSKTLWTDGKPCLMNVQKQNLISKVTDFNKFQRIQFATFVSLFIKTDTVVKYGLPIKEFFIWSDDLEFTRRISRELNCYFVPKSIVVHETSVQSGSDISKDSQDRLWRYEYAYRNEAYIYRREGTVGLILKTIRLKKHINRIKKSSLDQDEKKKRIKLVVDNNCKGKQFNPPIEYIKPKTIRVLQFFGEPLNYGGQESFIYNLYKEAISKKIQFAFATPFEAKNVELKILAKKRGDDIVVGNNNFNKRARKKSILSFANKIIKPDYDIVHIHSGSIFTLLEVSKIAKNKGVKTVIVHSHATGIPDLKYRCIKAYSDLKIKKYADYYFACSEDAAKWKFPKGIIAKKEYQVVANGIDTKRFAYNEVSRKITREKYKINTEDKVLIYVGRLSKEKNPLFLIDLLHKLQSKDTKQYKLFLVGEGELKNEIEKKIKYYNLEENVIMTGRVANVETFLNAADYFVFPSLYEGLGTSAIEAQINGLLTICSEGVPRETKITDHCFFISLDSIDEWVDTIVKRKSSIRNSVDQEIMDHYDAKIVSTKLMQQYEDMANNTYFSKNV